ncbi:MAG: hypothetical protein J0M35_16705 [Candidatus Obscuribacter phosphatis]|uniref:Uncharacterized protein n=1 Tax=Candidatus Obscuribacter phosphatis TaxID=1906157 RepID=A0A8J7P9X1_9BACT|nr:hypothetical protein [Candidatus Obscuribacter phosphatis]
MRFRSGYFYVAAWLGLTFLSLAALYRDWGHPLTGQSDQCMYLSMAELLLQGRVPYVQCFDNNPPLIIYLNVIPVVVAKCFALPLTLAFNLSVTILAAFSSALSLAALWLSRRQVVIFVSLSLAVLLFASFNLSLDLDYGQREHLFLLLYFPFFVWRLLRAEQFSAKESVFSKTFAALLGLGAALGLALKPYFVLMAAFVEMILLASSFSNRDGDFRGRLASLLKPECLALYLGLSIYALHFLFLPASMRIGLFQFVLPIYQAGYDYYTNSFLFNLTSFWRTDFLLLAFASLLTLYILPRARVTTAIISIAFAALAWIATAVYFYAGQSWQYHLLPIRLASLLLFSNGLVSLFSLWLAKAKNETKWEGVLLALAAVFALAFPAARAYQVYLRGQEEEATLEKFDLAFIGLKGLCFEHEISPAVKTITEHATACDTVLFLSTAMAPGYPAMVQSGRKPGSRFIHAMPLVVADYVVEVKKPQDLKRFQDMRAQIIDWYRQDIDRYKPVLIFVQKQTMSELVYRLGLQSFILQDYVALPEVGDTYGMTVYKRNPAKNNAKGVKSS